MVTMVTTGGRSWSLLTANKPEKLYPNSVATQDSFEPNFES